MKVLIFLEAKPWKYADVLNERPLNDYLHDIIHNEFLINIRYTYIFRFYFGTLLLKMGIYPDDRFEVRFRICRLVLSRVTPMELINWSEHAFRPSHWRPKQPFLSKQKPGWFWVALSLWQQLKINRVRFYNDVHK